MSLNVFKTEGGANNESIQLTYDSGDDAYVLETQANGTGQHKDILIKTNGSLVLTIKADGTFQILPGADNTVEIGVTANRLKGIWTHLINGATP